MYKLFYDNLKNCSKIKRVKLLGGDTDSFFLALTTDSSIKLNDIYLELRPIFDSSNYPLDHPLYSTTNKARLGCFKDETGGCEIKEMVLLKPKMYSISLKDRKENINRTKGISRSNILNINLI